MAADNCKSKTKEIKSDCVEEDSMLEANKGVGTYSSIQQLLPNQNKQSKFCSINFMKTR